MTDRLYLYIAVMAVVTYLIRLLPLVLFKNEIRSRFIKRFLYYVPYAALASMTFPAILYASDSTVAAACGFAVALILAWKKKSMFTVAIAACAVVFVVERLMG